MVYMAPGEAAFQRKSLDAICASDSSLSPIPPLSEGTRASH